MLSSVNKKYLLSVVVLHAFQFWKISKTSSQNPSVKGGRNPPFHKLLRTKIPPFAQVLELVLRHHCVVGLISEWFIGLRKYSGWNCFLVIHINDLRPGISYFSQNDEEAMVDFRHESNFVIRIFKHPAMVSSAPCCSKSRVSV